MIDAFVLAGGSGSRMGADKARVPLRGAPMAIAVAQIVGEVCDRVALVRSGDDGLPWPEGTEVVQDAAHEDTHPLWGVAAALAAARGDHALIVPCDLPTLTAAHIRTLLAAEPPAVACHGGRRHPLLVVAPVAWGARAHELARSGGSVHRFADACAEVSLPAEAVANRNRWEGETPIQRLLRGLPWLDDASRDRVAAGEAGRLAALGMVDPAFPLRYAAPQP